MGRDRVAGTSGAQLIGNMRSLRLTGPILVGLVVVRILVVVVGLARTSTGPVTDDYVIRFHEIATSEGRPYRDFPVEYAPGELIGIDLVGGGSVEATAARLLILNLVADLTTAWLVARGWGRRAGAWYLLLGTPLLWFSYLGFDLVSVLFTVAGLLLARGGRERSGGVLLAAAVWTRLWPVLLVPALWVSGRRRSAWWALGATVGLMMLWVVYGGLTGLRQVATFRGAQGWEFESLIGAVWWIVEGSAGAVSAAGASRFGVAPWWAKGILAVLALAGVTLAWRKARSDPGAIGRSGLAAVAVLLCCSPLFSYPFVAWMLPWAAVAGEEGGDGPRMRALAGVAMLLTAAAVATFGTKEQTAWLTQSLLVARNLVIVGVAGLWLLSRRANEPAPEGGGSFGPAGTGTPYDGRSSELRKPSSQEGGDSPS